MEKKKVTFDLRPTIPKIKNTALSNFEIAEYAKKLKIPHFRGVFMRDTLPKSIKKFERGVVNLDTSNHSGTHWVCYIKDVDKNGGDKVWYFDSFGMIMPKELSKYFGKSAIIYYNTTQKQQMREHNCGKRCLNFLSNYKDE